MCSLWSLGSILHPHMMSTLRVCVCVKVVLLSRVHHKYLVSLVGYCESPQQHILVYAYMPNGTLTEHIHGMYVCVQLDISLDRLQFPHTAP